MFTLDQKKAIDYNDGNILVSASAGSGKTSVMIERLTRLVIEGKAKISEILAVTFTDASALEMKEKLKGELIKKINSGVVGLEEELNDVRTADITTIDSFCSNLVRRYFFEAGVSPDYEIADEIKAVELRTQAIKNVFNSEYANNSEFIKYVDRFSNKRNDSNLISIVNKTYNFLSTEADEKKIVEQFSNLTYATVKDIAFTEIKQNLNKIKTRLEVCLIDSRNLQLAKGEAFIKDLLCDIEIVLSSNDVYEVAKFNLGKRLSFESMEDDNVVELKERVKKLKGELYEYIKEYKEFFTDKAFDEDCFNNALISTKFLLELTMKVKDNYDALKREENILDFSDLEHFALKVLDNGDIRKELINKYKFIFVDEYQDVNGTQEEIILKLTNDNCFMVGDEKQSIYGFRGCRPEFFNHKFSVMEKNNEKALRLKDNFRSSKAVVDMVNTIFNFAMTEDSYGIDYLSTSNLIYGGLFGKYKGEANLHIVINEKEEKISEEPRIYDIKEEIEKQIVDNDNLTVSLLVKIINEEIKKEYYDVKNNVMKKITYKDIAILTRSKTTKYVDDIIKGLIKNGIDVSSNAEEDICYYPEVQNAINLLRLIDCFYQDIPLVATLKGYMLNLTENELADIVDFFKENIGDKETINKYSFSFSDAFKFYIENANTELNSRLKVFCDYIEKIRLASSFLNAGEILERIYNDYSITAYLYTQRGGDIKVKRVQRLIEYCFNNSLSISKLLRLVDSGDKKITMSNGGNENSVKIMTIHSSKGLEFPVVIVCGLEKQFNNDDIKGDVLFDRDLGLAPKTFDDENRLDRENLLRKIFKERISKKNFKEELRLFYVAITRASYSLHMTAVLNEDKRQSDFNGANRYIDFIPNYIEAKYYSKEDLKNDFKKNTVRKVIISQQTLTGVSLTEKNISYVYPYLAQTTLPIKSSVTNLNHVQNEMPLTEMFKDEEIITGTSKGIAAHKILEYYDFNNYDFDYQLKRMLDNNIIGKEEINSIDIDKIKCIVQSKIFNNLKNKKIYREQGFLVQVNARDYFDDVKDDTFILVQGIIDLLIIDGKEAEIVDYKYSKKSKENLIATYKKQLELYAEAVEKSLNLKVRRKTILSLLTGESIEID